MDVVWRVQSPVNGFSGSLRPLAVGNIAAVDVGME
jgi:hypothetical protein